MLVYVGTDARNDRSRKAVFMKTFEHPAKKMFGKLADLKAAHDRTDIGLAPLAGQHMRVHEALWEMLGSKGGSFVDQLDHEHAIFAAMPVIREYVKHRAEGMTALTSWQWAKSTATQKESLPDGFNTNGRSFEMDGFDISIEMTPDMDPDYSFYGEFIDNDQDGAVKNPAGWTSHGNRNNSYAAYFVPTYTLEERYADLHKAGMDKQSARLAARDAVLKDLECAKDYSPFVVTVTASRNGIELGSDTMGGMDYDDPEDGILGNDMINNAIEYAKEALAKLIKSAVTSEA